MWDWNPRLQRRENRRSPTLGRDAPKIRFESIRYLSIEQRIDPADKNRLANALAGTITYSPALNEAGNVTVGDGYGDGLGG